MEGSWRKASFSNGGADNCVEVHSTMSRIRDSKSQTVELRFETETLPAFIATLKNGRLSG